MKKALVDRYINENEEELGLDRGSVFYTWRVVTLRASMMEHIEDVEVESVVASLELWAERLAEDWEEEEREREREEEKDEDEDEEDEDEDEEDEEDDDDDDEEEEEEEEDE